MDPSTALALQEALLANAGLCGARADTPTASPPALHLLQQQQKAQYAWMSTPEPSPFPNMFHHPSRSPSTQLPPTTTLAALTATLQQQQQLLMQQQQQHQQQQQQQLTTDEAALQAALRALLAAVDSSASATSSHDSTITTTSSSGASSQAGTPISHELNAARLPPAGTYAVPFPPATALGGLPPAPPRQLHLYLQQQQQQQQQLMQQRQVQQQRQQRQQQPPQVASQSLETGPSSLYVKGLPPGTDHHFLVQTFSPYGTLHSCKIKRDPSTGQCSGVAFINYQDRNHAMQALQALDGAHLSTGGRLNVQMQASRSHRAATAASYRAAMQTSMGGLHGVAGGLCQNASPAQAQPTWANASSMAPSAAWGVHGHALPTSTAQQQLQVAYIPAGALPGAFAAAYPHGACCM